MRLTLPPKESCLYIHTLYMQSKDTFQMIKPVDDGNDNTDDYYLQENIYKIQCMSLYAVASVVRFGWLGRKSRRSRFNVRSCSVY